MRESIEKIIEIIKDGALKFGKSLNNDLRYYFKEKIQDNEIIIHFGMMYGKELEYVIVLKKQNVDLDYIPEIAAYERLSLSTNPYEKLTLTDENIILSNIYTAIQNINKDEIACYEKLGIILRNPLELKGIYSINIKYVTD